MGNGVDPEAYIQRPVGTRILGLLPEDFGQVKDDKTIGRVMLWGPPASGKTSILGHIYKSLKERYSGVPVFYVNVSAYQVDTLARSVLTKVASVNKCVVLLDDAHLWYQGHEAFFGQFKNSQRILIAAATYSVDVLNPSTPVDFQETDSSQLENEELQRLFIRTGVDEVHREKLKYWFGNILGLFSWLYRSS